MANFNKQKLYLERNKHKDIRYPIMHISLSSNYPGINIIKHSKPKYNSATDP